jgi:hypothetical protein
MSQPAQVVEDILAPFSDARGHMLAELRLLDLLIERRIRSFRLAAAALEGKVPAVAAYISDEEADWLLRRPHNYTERDASIGQLDVAIREQEALIGVGIAACEKQGVQLPLLRLAHMYDLSWLEFEILMLCLAPELRRKYDRIYAYLQDDITRKRPSLDLALDVFIESEAERWSARAELGDGSNLFAHRLVQAVEDAQSPSGSTALACMLKLDQRILQFILGGDGVDRRIATLLKPVPVAQGVCVDERQLAELQDLVKGAIGRAAPMPLLLHLHGADDSARRDLAVALCQTLGSALLAVDGRALLAAEGNPDQLAVLVARESLLTGGLILIEHVDGWFRDEAALHARVPALFAALRTYCPFAFASAAKPWPGVPDASMTVMNVPVTTADDARRGNMWQQALHGLRFNAADEEVARLTQQFQLNSRQIGGVSRQLRLQAGGDRVLPLTALAAACRDVSHHGLGDLSVKVKAHYQWDDLVLPAQLKQQLQDVCAQVRFRRQVFDDWGFAQKLPYGRGLSAMFSGNPGTGKTMAAQVIARDLQLELFKIDLSGVVSKYIGETEKNLNRVFAEAQASNAILFFDEADALFGKRTEVSDAHDRYANIEVSYLLQKMEEYDGIVILATNFRNNVDDAFTRRIRFILEFPFPDAEGRREIWRRGIPAATPVAGELDFQWLADRIKVAGGNIKNIILNAAFLAAQQGRPLGMPQLLDSCRIEFQKIGKLWDAGNMQYTNR